MQTRERIEIENDLENNGPNKRVFLFFDSRDIYVDLPILFRFILCEVSPSACSKSSHKDA